MPRPIRRSARDVRRVRGLRLCRFASTAAVYASRPSGCAIEDVSFEGDEVISGDELAARIATAESSRLLAGALEPVPILSIWDALTVEYERFDRFVLERDLARIERYYRARGFYGRGCGRRGCSASAAPARRGACGCASSSPRARR